MVQIVTGRAATRSVRLSGGGELLAFMRTGGEAEYASVREEIGKRRDILKNAKSV